MCDCVAVVVYCVVLCCGVMFVCVDVLCLLCLLMVACCWSCVGLLCGLLCVCCCLLCLCSFSVHGCVVLWL